MGLILLIVLILLLIGAVPSWPIAGTGVIGPVAVSDSSSWSFWFYCCWDES